MRATEIMVGDWVLWKNKPVQVVRVSGIRYEFNHYDVLLAYCNDRGDGIECHDISSISSIPLTPEILEKNGFGRNLGGENNEINMTCKLWGGKGTEWWNKCIATPKYVHELQHALRLCGLNELADNFKV